MYQFADVIMGKLGVGGLIVHLKYDQLVLDDEIILPKILLITRIWSIKSLHSG
jgi:hypothetical protein